MSGVFMVVVWVWIPVVELSGQARKTLRFQEIELHPQALVISTNDTHELPWPHATQAG